MSLSDYFAELVKDGFESFRKSTERDEFGASVEVWPEEPNLEFSGVLRHLTGSKRYIASVHGYDADYRLYTDPPLDIQPGDRVVYDNAIYEVKAVNDVMSIGSLLQVDMLWVSNV
jgi:hypothetical protein